MKTLLAAALLLFSFNLSGQTYLPTDWPGSLQKEINKITNQDVNAFFIYYMHLGPWTNMPDSCKNISSVWILWEKDKKHYAKYFRCDSVNYDTLKITVRPFTYFRNHRHDFKLRNDYFRKMKNIPSTTTEGLTEYLIFKSSKDYIVLNLPDYERTDKEWNSIIWVKKTIEAFDLVKQEINIK
jgi:hypothetical protein